jgi:hypothetical protein
MLAAAVAGLTPLRAAAAPVRGTVVLPAELRSPRRHLGYWRVENGIVPIVASAFRPQTAVVLTGFHGAAPPARTVTVEIAGLQASPPLLVVGPGSVVEVRNNDKVPHDLGIPDKPNVMPIERLTPGNMRRQRFGEPGGYFVRCAEYPHLTLSVVVVDGPYFALVDDKGAFKLPDVPEGKGTLKVWSHGRWVHEQPVEVSGKGADLQVPVPESAAREATE